MFWEHNNQNVANVSLFVDADGNDPKRIINGSFSAELRHIRHMYTKIAFPVARAQSSKRRVHWRAHV